MKFIQMFFFLLNSKIISFFKEYKLITEINNIKNLTEKIEYENRLSLILFFADDCKYCHQFKPEYIKLSLKYHNVASFYAVNIDKCKNITPFKIDGIPNIFYYYKGEYINNEYDDSFELISKKLNNDYIYKCELFYSIEEIEEFKKSFKQFNISNYIIGLFNDTIYEKQFLDIINNYIGYIDKCIYFIDNQNHNNSIYVFNKQRNKEDKMINFEKLGDNLIDLINNKLRNIYEEFSEQKYTSILESQDKYFVLFLYNSSNEREIFKKNIFDLNSIKMNKNIRPFNFILFNFTKYFFKKISVQPNEIFIIDQTLKNFSKINNISIIWDLLEKISNKSLDFQKSQNYIREYINILEKNNTEKKNSEKENTEKNNTGKNNIISYIFYICLIIFMIIILVYVYIKIFRKKETSELNRISFNYNENFAPNYNPLNI